MHCTPLFRHCLATLIALSHLAVATAQNLVPNNSFETITTCPSSFGGFGPTIAPPWVAPTLGTPDIFNACAPPAMMGVPVNFFGNQAAVTGIGYAGFYAKLTANEYREYVQAPLTSPLVAGEWYAVSFYVSNSEFGCGVERIGAYFSNDAFVINNFLALDFVPQVESFGGYISDEINWTLIEGCFQAVGGEAHITIGCFHDDSDNPTDPDCGGETSYYYLDEVSVELSNEPEEIFFDLGGPEEACFEYEIDPGLSGYNFTWEDGSHGETLVVEESGTYSLTITDGCNYGIDSIEVTVFGHQPPVNIPETFVELCAGDIYTIELNPDLAEYTWQDGSNDASYDITESGTYSVTLSDGCSESEDEIEVLYYDPIEPIDLGEDQSLCFETVVSYSFDPSLGDFVWQDGSTLPGFTIEEAGTYSVTITNVCGSVTDEIIYSPLDIPEVDLGPDELLLCGDDLYDIEFDPDLGEFVWQDGTTFNYYTIDAPGTYAVFVTNQCGTGTDQIIVTETDSPIFNLGTDINNCAGESIVLTPGDIEGTYTWQDGSQGSQYIANNAGIYALTISNECGIGTDSIEVSFIQPVAQPDFGPDVDLCPGEEFLLTIDEPGATFLWQNGSTADSFLVTAAGTYYVTVQNQCNTRSDTIEVTLNAQPPLLDLPDNITLCQGQSVTIESGIAGVTYAWSDMSAASSLTVNTAGVYALTVSNNCGSSIDQVNVIDGGPAPAVDLGADIALCQGESQGISPVFADVNTWLWSDGSTGTSITVNNAGSTSVIVSNGCGVAYDTLLAVLLPAVPVFDLGNDTAVCNGELVNLSVAVPNVTIAWSDGSNGPDFTANTAGQYVATISNACGDFSDTITIAQLPAIPALDLGNDQSLCPGELIIIDPGIPDVDYLWHDGSTGSTFSTTQATTVSLTISNACGTATDQIEITESTQGPQLNLGNDIVGCAGDEIIIQSGISGVDYVWQDGSTQSSFTTNASGEFILNVSNNCGTDADTIVVDLSGIAPSVFLGADTLLCDDHVIILTVNNDGETSFSWQDGSTETTFEVNSPGTYSVVATNDCGNASDTLLVEYQYAPQPFDLGPDTALCLGESILLIAPVTADMIQWQNGSSASTFLADQTQLYSLLITNQCGVASDELQLTLIDESFSLDLDSVIQWCPQQSITLSALQPFPASYTWSTGETNAEITVATPGTYTVSVQTNCATASDKIIIQQGEDCFPKTTFYIPNVFSPNGDGINDIFTVQFNDNAEVLSMEGTIYDRWGSVLFTSAENPFTWNGKRNGDTMNPGVYVYVCTITFIRNGVVVEEKVTGDVSIIR